MRISNKWLKTTPALSRLRVLPIVNGRMSKGVSVTLCFLFALSVMGNIYLYTERSKYQEAWLNQFLTTEEIEGILKGSGVDLSFENIQAIANSRESLQVKVIHVSEPYISFGSDEKALKVNDTILLFQEGQYYGSKANLPGH